MRSAIDEDGDGVGQVQRDDQVGVEQFTDAARDGATTRGQDQHHEPPIREHELRLGMRSPPDAIATGRLRVPEGDPSTELLMRRALHFHAGFQGSLDGHIDSLVGANGDD